MKLHYGDLTDSSSLVRIISEVKPTEIYNLAAQSHVKVCNFVYRNGRNRSILFVLVNFPLCRYRLN